MHADSQERMMVQQQDAGVKPPDGSMNPKTAKQKGGPLGGTHLAATSGGAAEQQAQRCPRCDSLNTKFCYYNNYSLTQPRHFCKNCRRYWTKGGALRNVPVGGGCRKNKRLKHRDPSCLAALADIDASGPSGIFSSIGIPGFGPSTSSLIHELANEGHRLAYSRLGMQMLDKRFITDNDHQHQHPASSTTQDLFTLGGPPSLLGTNFDPSFPALTYSKGDPQSLLFHPHHASELTPFFDSINSPSSLTPTLDHLSGFTAGTPSTAGGHQVNTTSMSNTANMDAAAQLSLMHHMPMNGMQMQASHEEQQAIQANSGQRSFNNEEESADMNLRRSKGKSIISSLSDWGQQLQGPTTNANADSCFFVPPQLGSANDNGLWNVSWPEMHAALAGSAGAMLH